MCYLASPTLHQIIGPKVDPISFLYFTPLRIGCKQNLYLIENIYNVSNTVPSIFLTTTDKKKLYKISACGICCSINEGNKGTILGALY